MSKRRGNGPKEKEKEKKEKEKEVLIEDHFINNMIQLKSFNKGMGRFDFSREQKNIIGAFVRSYSFTYIPGVHEANGKACFEFAPDNIVEFDVTMVILKEGDGKETADRMVKLTSKFDDCCPNIVAEAHFSAYCAKINRYVVVYERCAPLKFVKFFTDDEKSLSPFGTLMTRTLVELFYHGMTKKVTHGALSDSSNYVVASGCLKVINIGRYEASYLPMKDIEDFALKTETLGGPENYEWQSFLLLLCSDRVRCQNPLDPTWKDDVLGHPMLLSSAEEEVAACRHTCTIISQQNLQWKCLFGNQLACRYQKFTQANVQGMDKKTASVTRDTHLRQMFDMKNQLFYGLFHYRLDDSTKLADKPHYGGFIHLSVTDVVRNTIHHGYKHDKSLKNNPKKVVEVIKGSPFGSYMSTAYSLSRMLMSDLQKDLPNGLNFPYAPPPPKFTPC